MSTVKVNKITPRSSNSIQLGESGDTLTIPSGATLQNCGTATGFGISFCTTTKTSPFTATAGKGFFINTGSAVTVTLPASPSVGDELIVVDATGCAATNNITLGRNGSKIKGACRDAKLNVDRGGLRIVYSGSSQGWVTATAGNDATMQSAFLCASGGTETTCGNYKIHTFTSDGTFTVNSVGGVAANNEVSYLVIAGGASGGSGFPCGSGSGGGGAGGFRESKSGVDCYSASPLEGSTNITVTATAFPITVGGGGAGKDGGSPTYLVGNPGSNSVFSTITSAGGGGGGSGNTEGACGAAGGSGGGGGYGSSSSPGAGNTPPVSPPQGNAGGNPSPGSTAPGYAASGGGGAGAAGSKFPGPQVGGAGGAGVSTSITGSSVTRAGGGGGSIRNSSPGTGGAGGSGGGGAGSPGNSPASGTAGTANTGGGGGGGAGLSGSPSGSGGSGLVVIRYKFQ